MESIFKLKQMINNSKKIVVLSGAGVSTASGLKDFRGSNGIYKEHLNYSPEYLLSKDCFYDNPELFFSFYKRLNCLNSKPNIVHKYLAKLEKFKDITIVTQNIDGLHQKAGSKNVLEIHGSVYENYCIKCNKFYEAKYIFENNGIPKCTCGGLIKPKVVLYGESLPKCFTEAILNISKCDLFIVLGTSLTVEPASSLLRYFQGKNLVIINNQKTKYDYVADLVINEDLNYVFEKLD